LLFKSKSIKLQISKAMEIQTKIAVMEMYGTCAIIYMKTQIITMYKRSSGLNFPTVEGI
jgi:hypothetical protein